MPIISTNLTKVNVERRNLQGKISVDNNINILDVQSMNMSLGTTKQDGIRFVFKFTSTYKPDAAIMDFEGEVLFLTEKDAADKIVADWKAKKPIDGDVMVSVMNSALQKSAVTALSLSQDMGLPAPIQLPRVTKKQEGTQTV